MSEDASGTTLKNQYLRLLKGHEARTSFAAGPTGPFNSGFVSRKLKTESFPSLRGPSILLKLLLNSSNCPLSFSESKAASSVGFVTVKTLAIRRSISPQPAISEPECGVPKKMTPRVESRMDLRLELTPVES